MLPQADGRIVLTLGDVAGKGSPAALLWRCSWRRCGRSSRSSSQPAALVARLNIQICRHSPASRFITLVYAIYEPGTGRLTYVNAGQNPPLIRRRDGRFDRLHGTGIALGLFENAEYTAAETHLEPGDLLVFYSDGITEAEDPSGQPLEETRPRARPRTARRQAPIGHRLGGPRRGSGTCPPGPLHRRSDDSGGQMQAQGRAQEDLRS